MLESYQMLATCNRVVVGKLPYKLKSSWPVV